MKKTTTLSKIAFKFALSFSLLGPSVSFAETDLTKSLLLCKLHKTVRTLRVEIDPQEKLCRTIYTKQGVDDLIGSGQFHESCENIVGNVRKNLEGAGWKCREVNHARGSDIIHVE